MRAALTALGTLAIASIAWIESTASTASIASAQPAPSPAAPPSSSPASSAVDATLAKLLGRIDVVAKEVSRARGLPLKRPIPNEVVDKDELRKRLLALAAEDKTKRQTASEALALARWGMVPLGTDYEALLVELLTEQIAGYYDTDTKKLTISKSAGEDAAWAELVLAHELQHALQDQSFDLKRFEDLPDAEGDARVARRALVEGDGVAVMLELMLARQGLRVPWNNKELADAVEKSLSMGSATGAGIAATTAGQDGLAKAPIALRESMMFPYREGFAFVAALRRRQPWSAVDAAFRRPPRSTEQILHFDKYVADDVPVQVTIGPLASLPGHAVAHETVWGELGFSLLLRSLRADANAAAIAARGWGGDRMIVLAKPAADESARAAPARSRKAVGIARLEWDTEIDAIEAAEAAVKAIDAAVTGALVEHSLARTRWLGLDGSVSWVERRGSSVVIVIGAPLPSADALAAEIWTASTASVTASVTAIVPPAKR